MALYWTLYILSLFVLMIECVQLRPEELGPSMYKDNLFRKTELRLSLLIVIPTLLAISFRDQVLDTYAYVIMYDTLPMGWSSFSKVVEESNAGFGFTLLATFCKTYLCESHYFWFFVLALVNLYCIVKICIKDSPNLALSLYLFIAGATFTWCLNGVRQFLVVTLLFLLSGVLLKDNIKNKLIYCGIILIGSLIHKSAIFLIPIILFVSPKRLYGRGMIIFVIAAIIGTHFSDSFLGQAELMMGKDYSNAFQEGKGTSIIRAIIVSIPTVISIWKLKTVRDIAPPSIILGLNMSLVGACFMFVASFTNGILVGRMPTYFTIYDLYIIPWLLYNCFGNYRRIALYICIILYGILFYYQMCVAWRGLPYVSYLFGLNL